MGVQVPPAAPKTMKNFLFKKLLTIILSAFFSLSYAENFLDFPFAYIIEACKITQQRFSPEKETQENILKGRSQYKTCMNFIMSLSSTLNQRCISIRNKEITPENSMTYADLSSVKSTKELINEIINYSKKFPHFDNQIAWLHASKAISQRWPCN